MDATVSGWLSASNLYIDTAYVAAFTTVRTYNDNSSPLVFTFAADSLVDTTTYSNKHWYAPSTDLRECTLEYLQTLSLEFAGETLLYYGTALTFGGPLFEAFEADCVRLCVGASAATCIAATCASLTCTDPNDFSCQYSCEDTCTEEAVDPTCLAACPSCVSQEPVMTLTDSVSGDLVVSDFLLLYSTSN